MKVAINIQEAVQGMQGKLDVLKNNELILRPVCFDLIDLMTKRIHIDGKDSSEAQIGTYSDEYMKVRTGQGFLSKKIVRGPKKGQARQAYNRTNDTRVIASLTRQLENDWTVVETAGGYGIGFLNELNYNKTQWLEHTYQKKIFELTDKELEYAIESINEIVGKIIEE